MVKRGGNRGKGKSITDLGDQATKDESKGNKEKELAKNLTKEQNRKIKEIEKSLVAPPTPMSTRSKTASDRKKAEMNIVKRRYDKKVMHEEFNSVFDDITNMVSSVNVVDVVGNERLSGKPRHSTENVLLACATPRSTKNKSFQLSDLRQVSNKKTSTRTRRNLDPVASKPMEVLALENKKDTKSNSTVDKSLARLQYSKETDEVELNTDNKSSKEQQDPSLAKEKYIELKSKGMQEISLVQNPKELDERQRNLDKPSKIKHEFSLEKGNKSLETKFSVNELSPILNFVQDIDERKLNFRSRKLKQDEFSEIQRESESECNINKFTTVSQCSKDIDGQKVNSRSWNMQPKQSPEIEKNELKCEINIFTEVLQCSENIDDQKQNINLKAFKEQKELPLKYEKEIAEAKSKVDQSMQNSKVQETKENMQSIDRNTSISPKEDVSSEEIKSFEPKNEQQEEIMNLREDANLCFEFDTHNVTVLVDNKDRYSDKNRNMIFNMGDGNIQLSLLDNKICINSQKGKIDCSIRRNRIIFSVADSLLQSDSSPENPSINDLSLMKDAEVSKDLRSTNVTETAKMPSLDQSEEMDEKQEYENVCKSTLKTNWLPKTLVAKSFVQQSIQNVTENFLAKIAASCKDFEIEFLDSLKKGNN